MARERRPQPRRMKKPHAAKTAPSALVADGFPAVAAQHILVLNFVLILFHPLEELVQTDNRVLLVRSRASVPYFVPLLLREVVVRLENRNVELRRVLHQQVSEPAHLLSSPTGNRVIVDCPAFVRHDEVFADSDDFSQSAAHRTGSERAVEAEKILVRLSELYPVHLELV